MGFGALAATAGSTRPARTGADPGIGLLTASAHRVGRDPGRLRHHRDTFRPQLGRLGPEPQPPLKLRQMRSHHRVPPCHRVRQIRHSTTVAPKPAKNDIISSRVLRCDLGFCTLAGTLWSDSAAATGKTVAPTVGKPRQLKLLGDQLVAVDENQTARVERHRPSARGANYTVLTDIHCMPRQIAEILDHSAPDLAIRPRIDTHPRIHRHAAIAGIASHPASALHPSFHRSSTLGRARENSDAITARPANAVRLMHDHHPADPEPGHALPDRAPAARSSCTTFTRFHPIWGKPAVRRGGEAAIVGQRRLRQPGAVLDVVRHPTARRSSSTARGRRRRTPEPSRSRRHGPDPGTSPPTRRPRRTSRSASRSVGRAPGLRRCRSYGSCCEERPCAHRRPRLLMGLLV